jgi:anaerobic selenocysteine-containing dehydrogenase
VLPDGRWRLAPPALVGYLRDLPGLAPDPAFVLVNRRQVHHTNSTLADVTTTRSSEEGVYLGPDDAREVGISEGDRVAVRSGVGHVVGVARLDPTLARGTVSVPHGFAGTNVGLLTSAQDDLDPLTGMVLQTGVPVTVELVEPDASARGGAMA